VYASISGGCFELGNYLLAAAAMIFDGTKEDDGFK